MSKKKYIHYGHSAFDSSKWKDVLDSDGGFLNKPHGGLWASSKTAKFGWYDWCQRENFSTKNLTKYFEFTLSSNARILELTPGNVWELPTSKDYLKTYGMSERRMGVHGVYWIDFEALARDYDVIDYNVSKYPELYWLLYGWDCDCILVLNKDVIVP
jgi:hypothetical protein